MLGLELGSELGLGSGVARSTPLDWVRSWCGQHSPGKKPSPPTRTYGHGLASSGEVGGPTPYLRSWRPGVSRLATATRPYCGYTVAILWLYYGCTTAIYRYTVAVLLAAIGCTMAVPLGGGALAGEHRSAEPVRVGGVAVPAVEPADGAG